MSLESLPKTFDFQSTERRLYRWWEVNGYFRPSNDPARPGFDPSRKPFVIAIPPPNVTGELHLGHAMFVSIEDLLSRYHRMRGVPTLWVPGSDHAGIATQLQVERVLEREGTRREEVGREKLSSVSGSGSASMVASFSTSCAAWAPPAIGNVSASRWMKGSRVRCARPSSTFTIRG